MVKSKSRRNLTISLKLANSLENLKQYSCNEFNRNRIMKKYKVELRFALQLLLLMTASLLAANFI
ncbi:hypothetical protein A9Q86_10720 [Flavobacteriales bacterium 33_180_T64]|nr:hypothetical protein A9Q86_10720 [Flavobacteriales bacterium 33_180_T64]